MDEKHQAGQTLGLAPLQLLVRTNADGGDCDRASIRNAKP